MVEKRMSFGNLNEDKTIYIIRPRVDCVEGLMSLFLNVIKQIWYAEKKGYIPVVDFKNYKTQYKDPNQQIDNVWEYYFEQPSNISLDEAYKSHKVILSGLTALMKTDKFLDQKFDEESLFLSRKFIDKYINFSTNTKDFFYQIKIDVNFDKTLGLYLRGTDYVKLRPAGHPVQPSAEDAIKMADTMMKRFDLEYVFLVTEDYEIYKKIKQHFQKKLIIVSFDSFITSYKGDSFLSLEKSVLSQLSSSPYQRGLNYLTKLYILSKCKCFVGGNTCGSWAANVFSKGYDESYIFDLGLY